METSETKKTHMTHDPLKTPEGLAAALAAVGSWAELSRRTGIPVSTLKSWGKKLGVSFSTVLVPVNGSIAVNGASEVVEARPSLADDVFVIAVTKRRTSLEGALRGETTTVDTADFNLVIGLDTVAERYDHERLLRAASLAIDGYRERHIIRKECEYLRRVAIACRVDADSLASYCTVLQAERHFRKRSGADPVPGLPILVEH